MRLVVTDPATADVARTSRYYDLKPSRYGAAFEGEVEAALEKIAAMPRLYSPVEDGVPGREYREYFIERFGQRVIYEVKADSVVVVAVIHASSREGAWHRNIAPAE
ncbi:MAG: type II toxin-antitoxin system RelE/ParE family toxin [Gemmataceae bacterium]|nr:type II toxin-antitoxin system RelE/ParE family toxin [Gemmataceae bacterium]